MALMCAAPILVLYAFSAIVIHAFHPRYMTALFPAYCLLIAGLVTRDNRIGRLLLVGVLMPWMLFTGTSTMARYLQRPTLRTGVDLVARERVESDLVICDRWQPLGYQVVWDWTRRLKRPDPPTVIDAAAVVWIRPLFPGTALESLPIETTPRIWLFRSRGRSSDRMAEEVRSRGFQLDRVIVDGWYHLELYTRAQR
jgi:hypothetical protein